MQNINEMCDEKTTNEQMRDRNYVNVNLFQKIMVRARIGLYYFRGCEWHFCTFFVRRRRRRRGVCVGGGAAECAW